MEGANLDRVLSAGSSGGGRLGSGSGSLNRSSGTGLSRAGSRADAPATVVEE